ncbi:MAG: phenylalanine--tRNA ligase subunit alpha [Myxococcota bacterium]|nr:phenylalanine--tRNA ligase subunit alpha [Myxococcota bacterium]
MSQTPELPDLDALEDAARTDIAAAATPQALLEVRAAYLGKKGSVAGVLRSIGQLAPEERGPIGQRANVAKARIEEWATERKSALESADIDRKLADQHLDVTLAGSGRPRGNLHLSTRVQRDVERFFLSRGFSVEDGPEVETEYNNFDALNLPSDHPAREMQDTFWVEGGHVLRTHTSPVQIRAMSGRKPPFRFIAPGRVYRHDMSPRHSPMFQQVEGFMVDEHTNFAHLKGVLFDFARDLMGKGVDLRFRASYFPFTEPSAEMDFSCVLCDAKGCATCSQTGWIEWGGCGMIHPEVLRNCGIDPDVHQGFAFGMGLERAAMLRHGVPQIRLLYEGDVRVLEQF